MKRGRERLRYGTGRPASGFSGRDPNTERSREKFARAEALIPAASS